MTGDLPDYTKYVVSVSMPSPPTVGNPKPYEGTVAVAGTPVILDVATALGHNAGDGYITNDGAGKLLVKVTYDGVTWSDQWTLELDEVLELKGLNIAKVSLDTDVSGTAYRCLLI